MLFICPWLCLRKTSREPSEDGGRHQGDRLGLPASAGRRGLLARAAAATGRWTDRRD